MFLSKNKRFSCWNKKRLLKKPLKHDIWIEFYPYLGKTFLMLHIKQVLTFFAGNKYCYKLWFVHVAAAYVHCILHIYFFCVVFKKMFLRKEVDWKKFQSEFILNSCLNVKELLARSRREIWSLSDCNWTQTHIRLVRKRSVDNPQPLSSLTFGQL